MPTPNQASQTTDSAIKRGVFTVFVIKSKIVELCSEVIRVLPGSYIGFGRNLYSCRVEVPRLFQSTGEALLRIMSLLFMIVFR